MSIFSFSFDDVVQNGVSEVKNMGFVVFDDNCEPTALAKTLEGAKSVARNLGLSTKYMTYSTANMLQKNGNIKLVNFV